jgi:predicted RNA-binding Zn-ribbon protein involved in translation (DUF1610 family)
MARKEKKAELKFQYKCSKCGNVAIKTSNKMTGVLINCISCDRLIRLDNESNYSKIKK